MIKEILNINKKVIIFLLLINVLIIGISYSYALFETTIIKNNIVKIELGTIDINLISSSLENNKTLTLSSKETKEITITLENTSSIDALAKLYYLGSELDITFSSNTTFKDSSNFLSGELKSQESITIDLKITNNTTSNVTIEFGVIGGLIGKELTLTTGNSILIQGTSGVEILKEKLGTDGLIAINTDGELYTGSGTIREYRYSGASVNNYVAFNGELWRIIGIFQNQNNEWQLKIMRNKTLTTTELPASYLIDGTTYTIENGTTGYAYWNKTTNASNNWSVAGLQYYLNTSNDESETPNSGYLSYISDESKSLIANTTYYLGNVTSYSGGSNDTAITSYTSERKQTNIHSGNPSTWTGLVGLMYPSDYGYSASNTYWNTSLYEYNAAQSSVIPKNTSWIYKTANHNYYEWFMSPSSQSTTTSAYWHSNGYVYNYSVTSDGYGAIHPVVHIVPSATFLGGDGTENDPYRLTDEEMKITAGEAIIKNLGTGGLVAINTSGTLYDETDTSQTIREYRYSGASVNNYIKFNNGEMWRIIGVFKNSSGEWNLKLMRNTTLTSDEIPSTYTYGSTTYIITDEELDAGETYWNSEGTNDWTTAGLQYFLNGTDGYYGTLATGAKSLIDSNYTYYLGNVTIASNTSDNTLTAYANERSSVVCDETITEYTNNNNCNIWYGNKATWKGRIALLYPSDYGYSADNSYWSTTALPDYETSANSWIEKIISRVEWTISPLAFLPSQVALLYQPGIFYTPAGVYHSGTGMLVRPVLNLLSSATIEANHVGSESDPYVVIE